MKKIGIIASGILFMILLGIFLINGKKRETEVTKIQTKVGFILNGKCHDNSWGQSHYEGMKKTAGKLNLKVYYCENVGKGKKVEGIIEKLIKKGCKIIICDSFDHGEPEQKMAKKYPNIYFFHATGLEKENNMTSYFGRIYQMRYLSGVVAGLQTESNEIGYVAAYPISEVNRGINAFTLGVRRVNKKAHVYVEWTNSWDDNEKAEEATNKLLSHHKIDVLTIHTDTNKPLQIAEEKGVWSIGYNMDNSKKYPQTFLTAPVWKWENFYETHILECLQGKFIGKNYWEGIQSGILDIAKLTKNVKPKVRLAVKYEKERLLSGTFDVFYGPIRDNTGKIRIKKGENMSDISMLNKFDWYVEGVILDEK